MSRYYLGETVRLTNTVTNISGQLVDPSGITVAVTKPDGTGAGSALTPTHDGVGLFHYDYVTTQAGHHSVLWTTSGPAAVSDWSFDVTATPAPRLVNIDDVKTHLRIPAADTSHDATLSLWVDACTEIVEGLVGPIVPRVVTEQHNGGRSTVVLDVQPIISVISVVEYFGSTGRTLTLTTPGATVGSYEYVVDTTLGAVTRYAGGTPGTFPTGSRNVVIQYRAGAAVFPPSAQLATLEAIRQHWRTVNDRPSLRNTADPLDQISTGGTMPLTNRLRAMLGTKVRPGGIG